MIVAIEGPSAAGKTTWCLSHAPHNCVEEVAENVVAPDLYADPVEVGQFWVNHAIKNWQRATAIKREHDIAVCDGDPFHLYFSWALWKSGALSKTLFEVESALYRSAFERKQIGFVDHVLWLEVPTDELRRRALSDDTRRRSRHELYLTLVPWMKAWYRTREQFLPGTVRNLPNILSLRDLPRGSHPSRYDPQLLDSLLRELNYAEAFPDAGEQSAARSG